MVDQRNEELRDMDAKKRLERKELQLLRKLEKIQQQKITLDS